MPTTVQQKIDFIASLSFDPKSVKTIEGALGSAFTDSVKKAAAMGGSRISKAFVEGAKKVAERLEVLTTDITKLEANAAAARTAADKDRYLAAARVLKRELQQKKRAVDLEEKAHEKYIDRQAEMLKAYDDLVVNMKVDKSQLAKDMGEALSGAFGKLSSGDLSGLVGSLGGMLSKGLGMTEAAGLAAGGAEAGGLAAAAASIGPIVAGVGAAVGVLAGVAAVFQMAYDQTKKYNQALTEGAGAADFFAQGTGNMAASLGELRGAIFSLGTQFRMDTEEIAKFTSALNTSGVTYKEFGELAGRAANDQRAFFDVTKTAIIASKALGIEASDAAGFIDKSMRDLGKTTLVEIQGAFSMINDAAARSGMTVKSFFTAINEATSGMALHNIRLEDTIGLLGTMTKVLGEDLAKERVKLEGQFKNMGYNERIKTVLTTGTAKTSKIVGADARAQAAALSPALTEAIGQFGGVVGQKLTESGKLNTEMLGKMSNEQFDKLVVGLRAEGGAKGTAAARQLENVVKLARGAVAPGDTLAQADALGQLSKSGELAMQLASASAVLGKAGKDIQGLNRSAFESITGISGENFEILQRLDRELRGQFGAIQEKIKAGTATEEEQKFAGMGFEEAVAAGLGRTEVEGAMRGSFSTMEKMTSQLLTETQSYTTILKNYIGWTLEKIYGLLEVIANLMPGGEERAKLLEKQEALMKQGEEANAKQRELADEIAVLARREAEFNLNPEDAARLAEAREEYKALGVQKVGLEAKAGALGAASTVKGGELVGTVEQKAAEVGAGGGGAAYAEEQAARSAAMSDLLLSGADTMRKMMMANMAAPGGSGMVLGLYNLITDLPKQMELAEGLSGSQSGVDLLADASGLTEEYTGEAKDTLAEMLDADAKYLQANGNPLAKISVQQKDLLDKLLSQLKKTEETEALGTLAGTGEAGATAVAEFLKTGKKEALNVESLTTSTDPNVTRALQNLGVIQGSPVNDFIYRGGATGGVITPINTADQLLGMKPGGPVDRAGRGGSGTVIININGDTATIVRTVKDVLQKAGLTASPNNGFA